MCLASPAEHPHPALAGLPAPGKEFSFHTSSVTSCRSDFDQVSMCLEGNKKERNPADARIRQEVGSSSSPLYQLPPRKFSRPRGSLGAPSQPTPFGSCCPCPPTQPRPDDLGLRHQQGTGGQSLLVHRLLNPRVQILVCVHLPWRGNYFSTPEMLLSMQISHHTGDSDSNLLTLGLSFNDFLNRGVKC